MKIASPAVILVTGPASSGKSEWAEYLASQSQKTVFYLATACQNAEDPEWQAKITQHIARRPPEWKTIEVPLNLGEILQQNQAQDCFLVDALGTWVANGLEMEEGDWEQRVTEVMQILPQISGVVILVAEETGWGLVPVYPMGRQFRDRLGQLTRRIGAIASTVYLVTGGYALNLTQIATPLPDFSHNLAVVKPVENSAEQFPPNC